MPMKRENYPPEWKVFSLRIRSERAAWRCECRGICGRGHDELLGDGRCRSKRGDRTVGGHPVVLTVAHLNHDAGPCRCEPRCVIDEHCLALCQSCHLNLDRPRHIRNQRTNRILKAGQLVLPAGGRP